MTKDFIVKGTMVDMEALGATRSFMAELCDCMLQTGEDLDGVVKKFGIPDVGSLDAVFTALNKAGDLVAGGPMDTRYTTDVSCSCRGYSIQGQCSFKGLTEFENAAYMPPRYVLADRFYDALKTECQKSKKDWAVLLTDPDDIVGNNPYTVECISSWDEALKEAKTYVAGKRLRKAYIYNAKEHRIVQIRHWVRKDFANFTNWEKNKSDFKPRYYKQYDCELKITM